MSRRDHRSPSISGRGHHTIRGYDPGWAERASELIRILRGALANVAVSIEHIGSTAVPGMGARPIIDIQVSVPNVFDRSSFDPQLQSLRYIWFPFPELPDDDYLVYVPADDSNTEHVAVCQAGSLHERRHLALRDYLRADPSAASQYEAVKRQAAEAAQGSREIYSAGKDRTVKELEQQALAWATSQT